MSVGNESIDQNIQSFQFQHSNFPAPPIPYPMAKVPYNTTGGSLSSTYTMKMCQHDELDYILHGFS